MARAQSHLRQRRMGMDVELDVLNLLPRSYGIGRLMDEVGRVQAKNVHTQDLTRVLSAVPWVVFQG